MENRFLFRKTAAGARCLIPLALLLALWLPGCARQPAEGGAAAQIAASAWVKTELYFGLAKPDGGAVSAAEWRDFLDREITARFPEGLTVLEADGQWTDSAGSAGKLVREKSKIVVLIHEDTAARRQALDQIVAKYKQLFQQESVLRVTSKAKADF